MAGKFYYDRKKKVPVVCLAGARFWRLRPEKKKIQSSVCWVRGSSDYDRKKKIQSSVWRVVLYVVSVFGSGGKLAVFLLWREIFITTGKKKIQSSVWRVVLLYCVSFWFWREIGSFFVAAGNFYYDRKKKHVCLSSRDRYICISST